ncbi:acyl CoA:acetate/3-ketoacid CoA transferase, alpha subunit [Metallosphaera yellowstonensis MK1]|uniref:Acyl CoA:acetate/3-ketoacid CoA transferase, alpha subunit n=1 Tax=Metallosphaera yellowstonensis MK1 TaxID=671065 RepID=H2C7L2_9CREN|nr:CoA-transferase [Metallosphaera yellowstonensis]EHP68138.1 acyl CoA:acetate/3-ketoacid CoA transferase, alpha subunit [Metallosphaera yellowstonensis MK1]
MPLEEALTLVHDEDLITVSGISIHRNPMSFVKALPKSGVKNLSFIDREPGIALEYLLRENLVKSVRVAMATLEWFGMLPAFRSKVENGEVEFLEDVCGAFIAGIRAGAAGVPFMPVRGILGSDLVRLHERKGTWKIGRDPFSGEEILFVKAIVPDVAILHVNRADRYGNSEIVGPLYEDEFKGKAAKMVIVTTEEIVDPEYFFGRRPTLNAVYVDAVVSAPRGAEPTSMFPLYDADYEGILKLIGQG